MKPTKFYAYLAVVCLLIIAGCLITAFIIAIMAHNLVIPILLGVAFVSIIITGFNPAISS
jgi:hypothetical protein